jgi:hypothetical protein
MGRAGLALAVLLGSSPATLANFGCGGPIAYLAVSSNGSLYVNVGWGVWAICGVSADGTWGGLSITAAACRTWYAGMLAAQKSGHTIRLYFQSANSGGDDVNCASVGNWVTPPSGRYHIDFNGAS